MTAKSQQGIREIIRTLLSILEEDGVPRISSELFRRAKFNQPAAIDPFWTTLYYILQLSQHLEVNHYQSSYHCTPLVKVDQQPKRAVIRYVRWHLFCMGYSRTALFSDTVNSRELFLAFGWTLHKTRLFGKLMRFHLQAANNVRIPLKPGQVFVLDSIRNDIELFREEVEVLSGELYRYSQHRNSETVQALKGVLQRLVWLKGKLLYRWKSALRKHQGFQKMADRVHKYTQQSSGKSLTVHEVFLLKYPDQLTGYLTELERHLLALQRLLDWQSSEYLFWQWMESVLDLEENERKEKMDNLDLSEEESHFGLLEAESMNLRELGTKVKLLEQEVCALLEKNRPHIDKINRSWMIKSKDVEERGIWEELSRIESAIGVKVRKTVHREWPCSLSYRGQIEQLNCTDVPVYLPEKPVVEKNSRKSHLVISNSLHEEYGVTSDVLDSLKARLVLVNDKLKATVEKIERSKLSFTRQLETIESLLPPSICKVET